MNEESLGDADRDKDSTKFICRVADWWAVEIRMCSRLNRDLAISNLMTSSLVRGNAIVKKMYGLWSGKYGMSCYGDEDRAVGEFDAGGSPWSILPGEISLAATFPQLPLHKTSKELPTMITTEGGRHEVVHYFSLLLLLLKSLYFRVQVHHDPNPSPNSH